MIRITIVDDHPLIVRALLGYFALEEDIEAISCFSDGANLLEQLIQDPPDVLLLDLRVPHLDPLSLVKDVRATLSDTKIAVITAASQPALLKRLLEAGVTGIQLKTDEQDPAEMVRVVNTGSLYLSPEASALTQKSAPSEIELDPRDRALLDLLADGLTNEKIAEVMQLSNGTVGNYTSRLYRTLGVSNRLSAVAWWSRFRGQYQPRQGES